MVMQINVTRFQYEYIKSKAKYNVFMAGRRAGKTSGMEARLVTDAAEKPGHKTMYITPSGSLCHEVFRDIVTDKGCRKRIKKIEKQPIRQIFWRNGSSTSFFIFDDPDKALGFGYDHVAFDEIQRQDSLHGRDDFMRVLRPLIMDRKGVMTIAGQWRGESCWWYKWWQKETDNGERINPDFRLWNIPSWEGIKFWPLKENDPEILDAKRIMTPQLFAQDIACIPAGNANAAFNFYDIRDCTSGQILEKGIRGRSYAIGADLGKTVDPSAWVVIDIKSMKIVQTSLRPLGEKHIVGARKLQELSHRFNDAYVVIDATGGAVGGKRHKDAYLSFYRKYVKNLGKKIITRQSKEDMISKLMLAFQNQSISIPETEEVLLAQLSSYEAHPRRWGGFMYHGPGGHDDDLVIAIAIAYDLADRYGAGVLPEDLQYITRT